MSDVARLRTSIAREYWAMNEGLSGLAVSARHQFIRERQHRLEHYHALLSQAIGQEQATRTVISIADGILEAHKRVEKRETKL